MSFLIELKEKVNTVQNWYGPVFRGYNKCEIECPTLTDKEEEMYKSSTRWHLNSHFREEDWIKSFGEISEQLNVKDKMIISKELLAFVKRSRSSMKDQLVLVPDLLECLDVKIKALYSLRLEENRPDEYDYGHGVSGEDQIFFIRFFAPSAFLKTYMNIHTSSEISECLPDLFKIGGNSARSGLFPEVTGVCILCASECFESFSKSGDEDMEIVNKFVIKKQFKHKFYNPIFFDKKNVKGGTTSRVENSGIQLAEDKQRKVRVNHAKIKVAIHEMNDRFDEAISSRQFIVADEIEKEISGLKERADDLQLEIDSVADIAKDKNVQNLSDGGVSEPQNSVEKNIEVNEGNLDEDLSDFDICNPFSAVDVDFKISNPFAVREKLFSCHFCNKTFSEEVFVEMHNTNFHSIEITPAKRNKILKLHYVECADTSIKSFTSKDPKLLKKVQTKKGKP